jgi:hypothetical protein
VPVEEPSTASEADINHHLFSAVVALIRLSSLVGPLKSACQRLGIGSLVSQAFSYLISHLALWLTITASRPPIS